MEYTNGAKLLGSFLMEVTCSHYCNLGSMGLTNNIGKSNFLLLRKNCGRGARSISQMLVSIFSYFFQTNGQFVSTS